MQRLRHFLLENSATTALVQESIPPIPKPVTRRQIDNCTGLPDVVAPSMPAIITVMHAKSVGRLPILSARPPRSTDPKPMPINSIESTTPSAAGATPHSLAIPELAKEM